MDINARMIDLYINVRAPQQSRIIATHTQERIDFVLCYELVAHAQFNMYFAKLHFSPIIGDDQHQFQSGVHRHQEITEWVFVHRIFMEGCQDDE
jgi:hypothetical protein